MQKKKTKKNTKKQKKKKHNNKATIPSVEVMQLNLSQVMTSTQVVEASVTTKNSPFQTFTHHGRSYSKVQKNLKTNKQTNQKQVKNSQVEQC